MLWGMVRKSQSARADLFQASPKFASALPTSCDEIACSGRFVAVEDDVSVMLPRALQHRRELVRGEGGEDSGLIVAVGELDITRPIRVAVPPGSVPDPLRRDCRSERSPAADRFGSAVAIGPGRDGSRSVLRHHSGLAARKERAPSIKPGVSITQQFSSSTRVRSGSSATSAQAETLPRDR